jgi:hypothetical protein|tara:strand:+ start:2221 stop:2661 length:441 start_codon:yes stop_codon:yes gene_type:complete
MKKQRMKSVDGSEFTVFFLEEENKPASPPMIVDDAGVNIDTGKYVGGGQWPSCPVSIFSGPIGPKGHEGTKGWKGEQEAYAGQVVLPEDMVRGRLYKIEGIDIVARAMGEHDDYLFGVKHHDTWFYIPMDAEVRKIGQSEVDEYLS